MSQIEKELAIKKLSKRIYQLMQELEVSSLDLSKYSTLLSKGKFPTKWAKDANIAFQTFSTEMRRISEAFTELFKEDIDAVEEILPPIKVRKRK